MKLQVIFNNLQGFSDYRQVSTKKNNRRRVKDLQSYLMHTVTKAKCQNKSKYNKEANRTLKSS